MVATLNENLVTVKLYSMTFKNCDYTHLSLFLTQKKIIVASMLKDIGLT